MLAGRIANKRPWTVEQLYALPQVSQVTRHVCVEGWSMIGKWTGTPLKTFLERVGADTTAQYVGFECADGYYEGMDMPTALHPQTIMAFRLSDEILPRKYGYPFKIRMPTKLGFKNPKFVTHDLRHQRASRAASGRIGATTGSAGSDRMRRGRDAVPSRSWRRRRSPGASKTRLCPPLRPRAGGRAECRVPARHDREYSSRGR